MGAVHIYSKPFREWFSGSKVVEADGRPLVVYHGFTKGAVDRFKGDAYFAFDSELAESYAEDSEGGVHAFYLSLRNPLVLTTGEDLQAMWEAAGPWRSTGLSCRMSSRP